MRRSSGEFRWNSGHTSCSPVVHVPVSAITRQSGKLLSGETVMAAEPANVKLVTGVDDTRLRENEFVELLVETGATEPSVGFETSRTLR